MRKEVKSVKRHDGNGKYITTTKELKDFTKQVQTNNFGDKHFEKAYNQFRTPAYSYCKQERSKEDGSICNKQ